MLKLNIEKIKQVGNKQYFKAEVFARSSSRKYTLPKDEIIQEIIVKYGIQDYKLLESDSAGNLTNNKNNGIYVLEINNSIDILKNNVKINTTKIEAELSQSEIQQEDASLPYGLKKTTKRKRATKKN
tara:strand:- start:50 stop:430 length:381 start_codon:yes stop_codon:yes gene_type:complete